MSVKKFVQTMPTRIVAVVWLGCAPMSAQVLVVDQASGTTDEVVVNATRLPDSQIAQSFTPSLSAVGFVQFQTSIFAISSGEVVIINLRQDAYNGPIISSTDPVILLNKATEINTFYYPANIPVSPGQRYYFEPVLLSAGPLDVAYKFPSSYPGGEAWNNGVPSGEASDYWFREGIVVPEPVGVWLLLLGGGLFVWHRAGWRRARRGTVCVAGD